MLKTCIIEEDTFVLSLISPDLLLLMILPLNLVCKINAETAALFPDVLQSRGVDCNKRTVTTHSYS